MKYARYIPGIAWVALIIWLTMLALSFLEQYSFRAYALLYPMILASAIVIIFTVPAIVEWLVRLCLKSKPSDSEPSKERAK